MFEQIFKNIDDVLWKEAGCTTELDYTEQTSWMLFLKYLDDLEGERAIEAELIGPGLQTAISRGQLMQKILIGNGNFKDRREKARWISHKTFDRLNCQEVLSGDCIVSRLPDPVGRSCIIPDTGDKMITAVDCSILRFDSSILFPDFFNYYSQAKAYLAKGIHR